MTDMDATIAALRENEANFLSAIAEFGKTEGIDQRALAIARTEFQTACLWLERALTTLKGKDRLNT